MEEICRTKPAGLVYERRPVVIYMGNPSVPVLSDIIVNGEIPDCCADIIKKNIEKFGMDVRRLYHCQDCYITQNELKKSAECKERTRCAQNSIKELINRLIPCGGKCHTIKISPIKYTRDLRPGRSPIAGYVNGNELQIVILSNETAN